MPTVKGAAKQTVTSEDLALAEAVMQYLYDPLGFVMFIFPWGEPGTPLADEAGPDEWQVEWLTALGEELVRARNAGEDESSVIRMATATGHGVGKTADVAWLILWFMSTHANPQCVVTANTLPQLKTKTWRELAKWHQLALNRDWFEWTATQFKHRAAPNTWFATAIPWSEHNSTAFAGTHENDVLIIMDEASEIADVIWEVAEGALTTAKATNTVIWAVFGNPTSNTGRFRQCWTKFRAFWRTFKVDARKSARTDKALIKQWIEAYGEDSDFVRVRVLGEFPRVGATQLISNELVERAQARHIDERHIPRSMPRLMGVDIARQGDDSSVCYRRWGPKLYPAKRWRVPDLMVLAGYIAQEIREHNPDVVFIDAVGMGAGVYDRLVQLGFTNVVPCYAGNKDEVLDKKQFYNPVAEWWVRMREWLKTADIPDDNILYEDLIGRQYGYNIQMLLQLERKEDMKKRGLPSPDDADALALTFAQPVPMKREDELAEDLEPDVV